MNELTVFENSEFGSVRTVDIGGKTHFVANDVAKALGYVECAKAVRTHCKGVSEMDIPTNGGIQKMKVIPEGDIYRLIIKSQLPSADKFERWIFDEVLPSIRKHGMYATDELINNPDLLIAVATELKAEREKNKALREEKESLEAEMIEMDKAITEMQPKADYVDRILSSKDCMTVSQIAQDYGMSAKRFNRVLASACIQRKVGEQWILYADHQGKGYVRSKTHEYPKNDGSTGTKQLTVWTQKGRMFIYERLKAIGIFPEMEMQSA